MNPVTHITHFSHYPPTGADNNDPALDPAGLKVAHVYAAVNDAVANGPLPDRNALTTLDQ